MQRILTCTLATAFVFASAAQAAEIKVNISVVDYYDQTQPIDWQSGWSLINLYATGYDGTVYYPERGEEGEVFILPESGLYKFDGQGAYVCGVVHGQEFEITAETREVKLLGWCE